MRTKPLEAAGHGREKSTNRLKGIDNKFASPKFEHLPIHQRLKALSNTVRQAGLNAEGKPKVRATVQTIHTVKRKVQKRIHKNKRKQSIEIRE